MNNINPKIWGSSAWSFLFYITQSYPDVPTINDQLNMKNFLMNMGNILPCQKCRINFYNHLKKFPIDTNVLMSKQNLTFWLVNIYNEIRVMNRTSPLTYSQIINKYLQNNNVDDQSDYRWGIIFILCMVIILMIMILYLKFY